MSETIEAPETITPPPEEAPAAPVEAVEATPAAEAPEQAEAAPETPAEAAPKPKQGDRRFANVTAKLNYERQERERLERELAAHRELLQQLQGAEKPEVPAKPREEEIRAAAAKLRAEERQAERLNAIVATGKQKFAEQWDDHAATLHNLGATQTPAFMEALMEADNPADIVAELAADTDALVELLAKGPTAIATRIGRMDARMSTPKPAPKPTSNAPRPPSPVSGSAVPAPMTLDAAAKSDDISDFEAALKRELGKSKLFGF